MGKVVMKLKRQINKLAAISAVWMVVIISSSLLLGESGKFIQLLPLLCIGGFLSMIIEIYTNKADEE